MARRLRPDPATIRAGIVKVYQQCMGVRVDCTDAGGDAFLAVSMMNRRRWNEALKYARSAVALERGMLGDVAPCPHCDRMAVAEPHNPRCPAVPQWPPLLAAFEDALRMLDGADSD